MAAKQNTRNKVYGPYEIVGESRPDGRMLVTFKFTEVKGATILVGATDNYGRVTGISALGFFWATAEVTIWGVVQGNPDMLKRQQVRQGTGPMKYIFPFEETYDEVQVKAYNMSGGASNGSAAGGPVQTGGAGYSLQINLMIQPRGGFTL